PEGKGAASAKFVDGGNGDVEWWDFIHEQRAGKTLGDAVQLSLLDTLLVGLKQMVLRLTDDVAVDDVEYQGATDSSWASYITFGTDTTERANRSHLAVCGIAESQKLSKYLWGIGLFAGECKGSHNVVA